MCTQEERRQQVLEEKRQRAIELNSEKTEAPKPESPLKSEPQEQPKASPVPSSPEVCMKQTVCRQSFQTPGKSLKKSTYEKQTIQCLCFKKKKYAKVI